MKSLKNMMYVCLSLTLMIAGCGKKKEVKAERNLLSQAEAVNNTGIIPVYSAENEELEALFVDEDRFEDFAFVDEGDFLLEFEDNNQITAAHQIDAELSLLDEEGLFVNANISEDIAFNTEGIEEDTRLECNTVHFAFNSEKVKESDRTLLAENCQIAKEAIEKGKKITIQGHCCEFGPASYNLALSQKRAQAVKEEMIKEGVDANKISTIGFGQEMPLVWSDAEDKQTKILELEPNRRSEVLIN